MRLAFAVAFGLVVEIYRGALVPPLAGVIALQLLAMPGPVPPLKRVIGLFVVIAGSSLFAYAVSALSSGQGFGYAIGVFVLYLWGFALAMRPASAAAGAMILTMSIVVTSLSAVSTDLAILLVGELLVSVSIGIGLVYLAHATFPHPAASGGAATTAHGDRHEPSLSLAARSLAATLIMLPLHLRLTADGLAAMVVLITVATMLRQPDIARSAAYAFSFAAGNLLGGALAALTVWLVTLHQSPPVLITACAAASLFMAWQLERTPALAHVLLPGFVAFALLFGLAFSPLAPSADVDLIKRLVQIVGAGLYALAAMALLLPLVRRAPGATGVRPA